MCAESESRRWNVLIDSWIRWAICRVLFPNRNKAEKPPLTYIDEERLERSVPLKALHRSSLFAPCTRKAGPVSWTHLVLPILHQIPVSSNKLLHFTAHDLAPFSASSPLHLN